jgi:integrase
MTARKASLRVAHSSKCANKNLTAVTSSGRGSGCTCPGGPSYYVFHRDPNGKPVKSERVKDKKLATKLLNKTQVAIDDGKVQVARSKRGTFADWSVEYLTMLAKRIERQEVKPRTLVAYGETLRYANESIGTVALAKLGVPDIRRFYDSLPEMSAMGRDRHLRQLSACLGAAVDDERIDRNPVPAFRKKLRLVRPKRGKAPFEDGELVALWQAMEGDEPVYLYVARFSTETGLRLGEIAALDWPNVDLVNGRVYVDATWDPIHQRLVGPKDREPRTIYLTPQAQAVLEEWVRLVGAREEGPVFPHPTAYGGRLVARQMQRVLTRAMREAGVPRIHPELRLPRSFHSFRYTTSVLMQRRGVHPRLIEQTLGHGSLELSYGVYGGWTPEMLAEEARRSAQP